jgi:hypothetical protein
MVAADQPGRVVVLDATPYAGGLAARLMSPPAADADRDQADRLLVRAIDTNAAPAAVAAALDDQDVAVVDLGTDLVRAARTGRLGGADQLLVVDAPAAEPASRSTALDRLGLLQGHEQLARDAVIVLVATDPTAVAASPAVTTEHGRAVVTVGFDSHLASGGVIDLARLAAPTAAAFRTLTARTAGFGPGAAGSPELVDHPVGLPAGLQVPALVVDSGQGTQPAGGHAAGSREDPKAPVSRGRAARPVLTVVICAVIAVALAVLAGGGVGGGAAPAACDAAAADQLAAHDGHPTAAAACVNTAFGELSAQEKNPSLLIVGAPSTISPGQDIPLQVSVRNLVRDAFPPSSHGGYYANPASLDAQGLTRGHVHSACRLLASTQDAPQPDRVTAFAAIEDGGGGAAPDTVEVHLPGRGADGQVLFPAGSLVQCAAWAGDGSHRVPMDSWPNQVPAFDAVRITVAAS